MTMSKTFYVTTPLYYVNAAPHIGHSYTTVAADCLARYHRLNGEDVFFLTGTDEHGQKIQQAATEAGLPPQQFVDQAIEQFKALWTLLSISHDDFIRTTEPRHVRVVQECLVRLQQNGQLKQATYQGWYCTPDETFWTQDELTRVEGSGPVNCPMCQRPLEAVKEEGWYLPLRPSQAWLRTFTQTHQTFIRPQSRYNEILSLLKQPLPESLCITRPRERVNWGIPVPFSDQHVTYVWFDALLNYITAPGYVDDPKRFQGLWPADVQFIGKDILRHHAIYWPIVLHALGLPDEAMPQMIFAHGWWKVGEQKMSKSRGNIIDPFVVVRELLKDQPAAVDVYRYFLLRDVPFGQDGNFSEEALVTRLNADLGNDLGNLVHRTLSMIERYGDGKIPAAGGGNTSAEERTLREEALGLAARLDVSMQGLNFSDALEAIFQLVRHANRFIETQAPWQLAKHAAERARLDTVLGTLAEVIRIVAIVLEPFLPNVSRAVWEQLGMGSQARRLTDTTRWPGIQAGQPVGTRTVLFPRMESMTS